MCGESGEDQRRVSSCRAPFRDPLRRVHDLRHKLFETTSAVPVRIAPAVEDVSTLAVPSPGVQFPSRRRVWALDDQQLGSLVRAHNDLVKLLVEVDGCLLYTSPSPRDLSTSRMPSSA